MSKRSSFERRERDLYPTPAAAVQPLIPWLRGIRTFAEPCVGDGDLVRHLEAHGLRCVYQGDIANGQDALARNSYGDIDAVITNSPWERAILHALILHFVRIAQAWLLIDQNWAGTKQAAPYLACCTDILPIGRQIWIPGTRTHGKDDAAWFEFDAHHSAGPVWHPFRSAPVSSHAARCGHCSAPYRPRRSDSQYCSDTCRQRAHRGRQAAASLAVTQA